MYIIGALTSSYEVAVQPNTVVTVVQITAHTMKPLKVHRYALYPDSMSVESEPLIVNLSFHSTAGTGTAHPLTGLNPSLYSIYASAIVSLSAFPSRGYIIDGFECHPQIGYEVVFPLGFEPEIFPGYRFGIDVFAKASVNVRPKIWILE